MRHLRLALRVTWLLVGTGVLAMAQVNPALYGSLRWRLLGPWRGGKATAVVGVSGHPAIWYMGTDTSGVWKTDDAGRTWRNISDAERLTGIGALADYGTKLLYVAVDRAGGSAGPEGLYRSTDAGRTLKLVALSGQTVFDVWDDAKNPQVVLAASSDGISRSSDGGKQWKTVLSVKTVGGDAVDLEAAPDAPGVIYSAWHAGRAGLFPSGRVPTLPIYRSSDNGRTWAAVAGAGLPADARGRVSLAVAPGTQGQRVYAYMAQGVFRSDDGGAQWRQASNDPRLVGGGQFFHIYVDPANANVLYAMETATYRSTDAGATWTPFTGAPSGDDFNAMWIDPSQPQHMGLAVDQGTEVSLNGGHTWSSWYNQPTGQMYNVTTDNQFPFHLYASQQDSGTVAVPFRANDGQITYRDWWTTNGFESARITPDPLHPNLVYATGWFGSVIRTNRVTGQSVHVFERNPKYREAGSMPMEFLPGDRHTLLLGTQYVLATRDGGEHWKAISPDLTGGKGAITAIAASPVDHAAIWVGTSNGRIEYTSDNGRSWRDVTPAKVTGRVAMIEAGQTQAGTAFAVLYGREPGIYLTTDSGSSWREISGSIGARVSAIRQDPVDGRLLFAGTGAGVSVSFDYGSHWQSLELNLPASRVSDVQVHGDDLVISTYGRGLWALDDMATLRQLSPQMNKQDAHLFRPAPAIRMQWDDYTDTPLNPDEPRSKNPPDGAIIDYYLKSPVSAPLKLEIFDADGNLVNSYSSDGPKAPPYKVNVASYWLAPPQLLSNHAGLNRFVWNLRYPDPPHILFTYFGFQRDYFEYTLADHAIPHNTPWHEPQGPMVVPGTYKVVLTAGGRTYSAPLTVRLDPRLHNVTRDDLARQLAVAQNLAEGLKLSVRAYKLADGDTRGSKPVAALKATFGHIDLRQARLLSGVTQADAAPGAEVSETVAGLCRQYNGAVTQWNHLPGVAKLTAQACGFSDVSLENKKQ